MASQPKTQRESSNQGSSAEADLWSSYPLVQRLAEHLEHLSVNGCSSGVSKFDALYPPAITVVDYVKRMVKYTQLDDTVYLAAMFYLLTACNTRSTLQITEHNIHRLILASCLVATKFWSDRFYSNRFMAQVGGVAISEANELELEFCALLGWNLQIHPKDFDMLTTQLQKPATKQSGERDTGDKDIDMLIQSVTGFWSGGASSGGAEATGRTKANDAPHGVECDGKAVFDNCSIAAQSPGDSCSCKIPMIRQDYLDRTHSIST